MLIGKFRNTEAATYVSEKLEGGETAKGGETDTPGNEPRQRQIELELIMRSFLKLLRFAIAEFPRAH
jgi:hypothetical protein